MTIDEAIGRLIPNPSAVLERFSGEKDLLDMFLLKFPEEDSVKAVRKSVQTDDWNQILMDVHTLKGTSGNFGLDPLFNACAAVVTAIRAQKFDEAREKIPQVLSELDAVCNTLSQVE